MFGIVSQRYSYIGLFWILYLQVADCHQAQQCVWTWQACWAGLGTWLRPLDLLEWWCHVYLFVGTGAALRPYLSRRDIKLWNTIRPNNNVYTNVITDYWVSQLHYVHWYFPAFKLLNHLLICERAVWSLFSVRQLSDNYESDSLWICPKICDSGLSLSLSLPHPPFHPQTFLIVFAPSCLVELSSHCHASFLH